MNYLLFQEQSPLSHLALILYHPFCGIINPLHLLFSVNDARPLHLRLLLLWLSYLNLLQEFNVILGAYHVVETPNKTKLCLMSLDLQRFSYDIINA